MAEPAERNAGDDPAKRLEDAVKKQGQVQQAAREAARRGYQPPAAESASRP